MTESNKSDTPRAPWPRVSEAVVLLTLSIASYIYTFSSQRAFLRSFGIDDTFVSVELDAVVRAGVGFVTFSFLFINMIHLPSLIYSKAFQILFIFRVSLFLLLALFLPFYRHSGVNWITVIIFLIGALFFVGELFVLTRFCVRGGTVGDYFKEEIGLHAELVKKAADQKIVDLIGNNMWIAILAMALVPYGAGSLIGAREGNRKADFLEFQDADGKYLVVHKVSDAYLAVGYANQEDQAPLLDGRVIVLQIADLANHTLEKRRFKKPLLRSAPLKRQSLREWYQEELLPVFKKRDSKAP